ncbi:VOC family protein [Phenylobacterium sp. J367]|uniref:VOC family protein n=1 Tax=Phenylobacterium sp. J367 TaxID=2898435 RepID=UPI0021507841|nr:VOC family protein [Phenylobacterium sp. J367]MCR5878194.1 VOC family protein [Phenylobacterium sp. J367]
MITGLDHVAVAVRDFDAAVDGYRRLFAREPDLEPGGGAKRAWFRFPNAALEVIAPDGEDVAGDRVRARLDEAGEGLWILSFATPDLDAATRLAERRGLEVEAVAGVALIRAAGLQFTLRQQRDLPLSAPTADGPVDALDHVVVYTANPDRALALFGAKFGLDLRLDRENPQWGARQLFFRCGGAVVEVGQSLKIPVSDAPDRFGGLAWRVADPEAAQGRMAAAGFDVSEVRKGRKPGTHVFTVRDAPGGVPTLMLSAEPAKETV